mmetsp:Transcript_95600/g.267089  ORF Transcript_95600/g.267089 Transcript_95600/m.267089 type:complete len:301 (+) Transcript_95600:896-1798(+)
MGQRVEMPVGQVKLRRVACVADDHKVEPRGAVVPAVEVLQRALEAPAVPLRLRLERLQVPGCELVHRVLGVRSRPQQVPEPPLRVRLVLLVLRVHRVDLLVDHLLLEGWRDEELGEYVQTFLDAVVINLVEVHRFLGRGVGVVLASVQGQRRREGLGVGVLLGAQEEHVLAEVRQALEGRRVLQRAGLHRHREARLLRLGVADDQHAQARIEGRVQVGPLVGQRLADLDPRGALAAVDRSGAGAAHTRGVAWRRRQQRQHRKEQELLRRPLVPEASSVPRPNRLIRQGRAQGPPADGSGE